MLKPRAVSSSTISPAHHLARCADMSVDLCAFGFMRMCVCVCVCFETFLGNPSCLSPPHQQ